MKKALLILFVLVGFSCARSGVVFTKNLAFRAGPGFDYPAQARYSKAKFFEIIEVRGDWVYARANGVLGYFPADSIREVRTRKRMMAEEVVAILLMGPDWHYDTITVIDYPLEVDLIWIKDSFAFIQVNGSGAWVNKEAISFPATGERRINESAIVRQPDRWQYGEVLPPESHAFENIPDNDFDLLIPQTPEERDDLWRIRQIWLGTGISGITLDEVDVGIYRVSGSLNRIDSESNSVKKDELKSVIPISIRASYLIESMGLFLDIGGSYSFNFTESVRLTSIEGGMGLSFSKYLDTRIAVGYSFFRRKYETVENTDYITKEDFPHVCAEIAISGKAFLPFRLAFGLRFADNIDNAKIEFSGRNEDNFQFYDDSYNISMKFKGPYIKLEMGILP